MPRFAANLSLLFTEVPLLERFEQAAKAGFDAVELLFPYAFTIEDLRRRIDASGVDVVLVNTPPGDWDAGERGCACDPDRIDDFRAGLASAIDYALALGCPLVHCMAGQAPEGVDDAVLSKTYVGNLRHAAAQLQRAGLAGTIEPINRHDMPGYYLSRTAQAIDVLDAVGAHNLKLQYDIYHAQRSEGELAATISAHLDRIGHVQIADNPGRHEPGSGEINFDFLFEHLDRIGYAGYVGCEYRPAVDTLAGLGWLERARRTVVAR